MDIELQDPYEYMDNSSNEIKKLYEQGNIFLANVMYFIDYSANANLGLVEYFINELNYSGTDVAFSNMNYKKLYDLLITRDIKFDRIICLHPKSPRDKIIIRELEEKGYEYYVPKLTEKIHGVSAIQIFGFWKCKK
jgi:hypothetical protein